MTYQKITLAGAVLASAMAMSAPTQAQGVLDIGRILLGLPTEEKPQIEYRERAPLVVPPNTNLRPPVEGSTPDQRRANWPQDPDVVARRRAAEEARKPVYVDSITGREVAPTRRMTVEEIRAGRVAGQEVNRVPQVVLDDRARANVLGGVTTLRTMDRQSGTASSEMDRSEPRREFLTDPPTGVRRPADNAPLRATREGSLGARQDASPYDIYREGPRTR